MQNVVCLIKSPEDESIWILLIFLGALAMEKDEKQ